MDLVRSTFICALFAVCAAARADNAILECTADTWIARSNGAAHGRESSLELSVEKLILSQFRVSAIEGWTVEKALLLLHVSGDFRPGKVLLAPIASPWKESDAVAPALGKPVEAAEQSKPDGWIAVAVPRDLVQSLVTGKAFGLAVRLDGGETQKGAETHNGAETQKFASRETVQFSPFLVVQGKDKK